MNIDYKLREKINRLYYDGRNHTEEIIVYIYLLFNANYTDSKLVNRGQILTSYKSLARITHYSENEIRTIIRKLVDEGLITKASTHHYTIYTLLHYDPVGKFRTDNRAVDVKKDDNCSSQHSESDRLYFEELERKIKREPLTEDEKSFFNRYLGG